MDRPLALGGVSGAVTTLLLTISKSLLHPSDFYLEKGIEVAQQVCACSGAWDIEELPWWFFGGGFLAGILFGPFLDLCWILRERWRRFIWNGFFAGTAYGQQGRTPQAQYKVIA